MAATDAKSILALAGSDASFAANEVTANLIIIGLLRQILINQNAMAVTDSKSILANSACDAECGFQLPLIIVGLLRQIAINGSTGAGASSSITSISVPGPPGGVPPTYSNFVVDSNGRTWTYWGGAWH